MKLYNGLDNGHSQYRKDLNMQTFWLLYVCIWPHVLVFLFVTYVLSLKHYTGYWVWSIAVGYSLKTDKSVTVTTLSLQNQHFVMMTKLIDRHVFLGFFLQIFLLGFSCDFMCLSCIHVINVIPLKWFWFNPAICQYVYTSC